MGIIVTAAVILGIVALDQVSKALIVAHLDDAVTVIPGVLDFRYVENTGMAFGLLSDHRWVFLVFSTLGILCIGFYLFRYCKPALARAGLALVVGGGVGNMIDRVARGYVVDFIDVRLFPKFWVWVFNVADAAVCVGAALFILSLVLDMARDARAAHRAAGPADGGEDGGAHGRDA